MTHDEISDLLGAYALDVLSEEERAVVDAHLKTCRACAAEVEQLLSVHDRLGLAAIERDPPPGLRVRLMNLVELDRAQWEREQAPAPPPVATIPADGSWWERLRGRLRRAPALAYGVGGALVVAVVVLIVIVGHRNTVTVQTRTGGPLAAVVDGFDMRGVTATVGLRSDHTTQISLGNLPVLPSTLAYEIWLVPAKGNAVPIGGFTAGPDHRYSHHFNRDAHGYPLVAVSIERAPGDSPTPSKYLAIGVKLQG